MKILQFLLIAFVFLGFGSLCAQEEPATASFDELRRTIDEYFYGQLGEKQNRSEKISRARLIESTLQKNKSKYSEENYYKLASDIAHFFWQNGEADLAISSYEKISEGASDDLVVAGALTMLGWIHFGKGNRERAVLYFEPAIKLLNDYPDKSNFARNELAGRTIGTLANLYRYKGRKADAMQLYQSVLETKEYFEAADIDTLIAVSSNLAILEPNPEVAAKYYDQTDKYVSESQIPFHVKLAFYNASFRFAAKHGKAIKKLPLLEDILNSGPTAWHSVGMQELIQRARTANLLSLYYYTRLKEEGFKKKFQELSKQLCKQMSAALSRPKLGNQKNELRNIGLQTAVLRLDYFAKVNDRKQFEKTKKMTLRDFKRSSKQEFHPIVPSLFESKLAREIDSKFEKYLSEYSIPTLATEAERNKKKAKE